MSDVTEILSQIEQGDPSAPDQLLPLVYEELRSLAAKKISQEDPGQTLQATALVHEAYIRLVDVKKAQRWKSRGHFFVAAAEAMRRILVEAARRKNRLKRGGGLQKVDFEQITPATNDSPEELLAINAALTDLAQEEPDAAQLIKLRYFGGFSVADAAEMIGLSRSTAYDQVAYAKAWLRCRLESAS